MAVIFLHFSSLYLSSYLFPVFTTFALGLGVHIVLVAGVIFLSLSLSLSLLFLCIYPSLYSITMPWSMYLKKVFFASGSSVWSLR